MACCNIHSVGDAHLSSKLHLSLGGGSSVAHVGNRMEAEATRRAKARLHIIEHDLKSSEVSAYACRFFGISCRRFYTWFHRLGKEKAVRLRDRWCRPSMIHCQILLDITLIDHHWWQSSSYMDYASGTGNGCIISVGHLNTALIICANGVFSSLISSIFGSGRSTH